MFFCKLYDLGTKKVSFDGPNEGEERIKIVVSRLKRLSMLAVKAI